MKKLNKKLEIKKNKFYLNFQENFKDHQIKKIEENQKNLVDLGIYNNDTSFGAYYAFYKKKNLKWINSHTETKKETTNLIAQNLEKILFVFFNLKPSSLLDVGCGTGHITNSLKNILQLKHTAGIDPSKYAIKYAKKKFKKILFKEDYLNNLNKRNIGQFDIVYSRECYPFVRNNNLKEMTSNIKNLSNLLKSDGLIVFETYSHKKGINVLYHEIKKKLSKSHKMIKIIKFPNQFYWILNFKLNSNIYLLLSILIKLLYKLMNRQAIYYVIIKKI